MAQDTEHDRISRKAHELWESEGHPHGRDQIHWDEAKEIIALEDSMKATLLPRETGASEPEEPAIAVTNQAEMPNLTDQGPDDLTSIDREPAVARPQPAASAPRAETLLREAQSSPVAGRAPAGVTGPAPAKDAAKPASVTRGKSGDKG